MEIEKQKSKGTLSVIIILLLVIVGLAGFICYDQFVVKKESEKASTIEKQEAVRELTDIEKQVFTIRINALNAKFSKLYPFTSVTSISNQELLNYGLIGLYGRDSFTTDEIEENIRHVFGNGITIKHEDIICNIDKKPFYNYDSSTKTYNKNSEMHGHDGGDELRDTKFYYISAKMLEENKIIIEAKVLYGVMCSGICVPNNSYYASYNDSKNHKNAVITSKKDGEEITLTDDLYKSIENKLPITTYEFEKDANGSYNLVSVKVNK